MPYADRWFPSRSNRRATDTIENIESSHSNGSGCSGAISQPKKPTTSSTTFARQEGSPSVKSILRSIFRGAPLQAPRTGGHFNARFVHLHRPRSEPLGGCYGTAKTRQDKWPSTQYLTYSDLPSKATGTPALHVEFRALGASRVKPVVPAILDIPHCLEDFWQHHLIFEEPRRRKIGKFFRSDGYPMEAWRDVMKFAGYVFQDIGLGREAQLVRCLSSVARFKNLRPDRYLDRLDFSLEPLTINDLCQHLRLMLDSKPFQIIPFKIIGGSFLHSNNTDDRSSIISA